MITDQQFADWLKDDSAMRTILIEVTPKLNGVDTPIYLSSRGYVTSPTDTPPNRSYLPIVQGGVSTSESVSLKGEASISFGVVELENNEGDLDFWLDGIWKNRDITILAGDLRWERADFRPVFVGQTDDITSRSRNRLNLKLRDKLQRLNTPVTEELLGGSTDNKDRVIPVLLGEAHNIEPLLVSEATHTYQFGKGLNEMIIEVRDDGAPVGFTPTLDVGQFSLTQNPEGQITVSAQGDKGGGYRDDVAGLIGKLVSRFGNADQRFVAYPNLMPNGEFFSDLSGWSNSVQYPSTTVWEYGRMRVQGTTATYHSQVSSGLSLEVGKSYTLEVDVGEETTNGYWLLLSSSAITDSPDRVTLRATSSVKGPQTFTFTAAAPVMYLHCTTAPAVPAVLYVSKVRLFESGEQDIDTDNFATFAAAHPQAVGLPIQDKVNVLDACQQLARSVGASVTANSLGKLKLIKIDFPVSNPTFIANSQNIRANKLSLVDKLDVAAAVKLGYCRNWSVQTNLQTGLPTDHKDLFAQEWLTVTKSDDTVASRYRLHTLPDQEDTLLLDEAEATAEAIRRLNIRKVIHKVYQYEGFADSLILELGQSIRLDHDRFGLEVGKNGLVVGKQSDWLNFRCTIQVIV